MVTIRERILDYLTRHPEGVDDDQLAKVLNLKQRQQANARCRQLAVEGIVERKNVKGKIHNFLKVPNESPKITAELDDRDWYREENIQKTIAKFLEGEGYSIIGIASAAHRERGKDIEAKQGSKTLWITVKGYPKGTPKTNPSTQAGHWFKQALFDIVSWRGENPTAELTMALPDFSRYRNLAEKVKWLQPITRFSFMWVQKDGTIKIS